MSYAVKILGKYPAPVTRTTDVVDRYKAAYAEAFAEQVAKTGKGGMVMVAPSHSARQQFAAIEPEMVMKAEAVMTQRYCDIERKKIDLTRPARAGGNGALRCDNQYGNRNYLDLLVERSDQYLRGKITLREFTDLVNADMERVIYDKPEWRNAPPAPEKQFHQELLLNAALSLPMAMQAANPAHYPHAVKNPAEVYAANNRSR